MAAKPATKSTSKKTTRRGPTKAAALKALGLTQEDLNLLKEVASAREVAKAAPVPEERPAPVKAEEPPEQSFYARNLRNVEFNIRLTRQKKGEPRTELKPRGERGDLFKLQEKDLEDEALLRNIGLGLEIITAAEAKEIISKQTTNIQAQVNPIYATLRNELGQPYAEGAIKVEPEYNSQGVVVARLEPQGGDAGNIPSQGRGVDWQAARHPGQAAIGGNPHIISDGFNPDPAVQADIIARRKDIHGPAAGLGGVNVVVEETVKN